MTANLDSRIPKEDYENIKLIVGAKIGKLYFQRAIDRKENTIAHGFSLRSHDEKYICIDTDEWCDTYKEALNCFRLRVQKKENPFSVILCKTNEPLKIEEISINETIISRIDVYEFNDRLGDESVSYDTALLFTGDSGGFLIGIESGSIAGFVFIVEDKNEINEILKEYRHSQSITNA